MAWLFDLINELRIFVLVFSYVWHCSWLVDYLIEWKEFTERCRVA